MAGLGALGAERGPPDSLLQRALRPTRDIATINSWRNGTRQPGPREILTLSRAIADLFDEAATAQGEKSSFDMFATLSDLLQAAQRRIPEHPDVSDLVADRVLEWNLDKPAEVKIAVLDAKPYIDSQGAGLCGQIAEFAVRLMGANPKLIPVTWESLSTSLQSRDVDLIPPFMFVMPVQMRDMSFSDPIGLSGTFRAVLPAKARDTATTAAGSTHGARVLRPEAVQVIPISGELGQLFCSLTQATFRRVHASTHADAQKILLDDAQNLRAGERASVIITEAVVCEAICETSRDVLMVADLPQGTGMMSPLAFAVSRHEPRFLEVVNTAVMHMKSSGTMRHLFEQYSKSLGDKTFVESSAGTHLSLTEYLKGSKKP